MNIFHFLAAVYDSKTAEFFPFASKIQQGSNGFTAGQKSWNARLNIMICR